MPPLSIYAITVPQLQVTVDTTVRTAQFAVDVTNEQQIADDVVLDIAPVTPSSDIEDAENLEDVEATAGTPADADWFAVDRHQRSIPPSGSEQYLVSVTVPADIAPGSYLMKPMAYSADRPPDVSEVDGPQMTLVVPAPPPPPPPKPPWWRRWWPWWLVIAGGALVLIAAIVVTIVVLVNSHSTPTVTVPNVTLQELRNAETTLQTSSLIPQPEGPVNIASCFAVPNFCIVESQSPAGGQRVAQGSHVILNVQFFF